MVSNSTTVKEVFSDRNPTLVLDLDSYSQEELSAAGFTPEVVEFFGAEHFEVELQKKLVKETAACAEYAKHSILSSLLKKN